MTSLHALSSGLPLGWRDFRHGMVSTMWLSTLQQSGGEAELAMEMWWRAAALDALQVMLPTRKPIDVTSAVYFATACGMLSCCSSPCILFISTFRFQACWPRAGAAMPARSLSKAVRADASCACSSCPACRARQHRCSTSTDVLDSDLKSNRNAM